MAVDDPSSTPGTRSVNGPSVFISYRRADSAGSARELASACRRRFGDTNVFFDTHDLTAGSNWSQTIADRLAAADAVLVVIGPNWASLAEGHARRTSIAPTGVDVLRTEVESALRSDAVVIPVLVDDAILPDRESLPRPFRPLTDLQAKGLQHVHFEQDVERLLAELEEDVAQRRRQRAAAAAAAVRPPRPAAPQPAASWNTPDDRHFETILGYLDQGLLVPVVGAGVYEPDPELPWQPGSGRLPAADELARALADRFRLDDQISDLARVSQHIAVEHGAADLHRALREMLLGSESEPSPVHHFLARVPQRLRKRGVARYPLMLTTNYDTALERAFDAAREPFDLAVYLADGPNKTKFVHIPWWDGNRSAPRVILEPNSYIDFPVHDDGDLARPIIVKIHGGALHDAPREYQQLKSNFVITEDDYIGYLSRSPAETFVPLQILDKLRESHLLFLGYEVRDWNLRVFLRRIWVDERTRAKSWAVQRKLDKVDRAFWEALAAERFDMPPAAYLDELEGHFTT